MVSGLIPICRRRDRRRSAGPPCAEERGGLCSTTVFAEPFLRRRLNHVPTTPTFVDFARALPESFETACFRIDRVGRESRGSGCSGKRLVVFGIPPGFQVGVGQTARFRGDTTIRPTGPGIAARRRTRIIRNYTPVVVCVTS